MPLRIVYGRAGTGKSEYILRDMAALHEAGQHALLLVPEQASHQAETLLAERTGCLSPGLQALSFKRMAYAVMKECGYRRDTLDAGGKCMLLCRVIDGLDKELAYYRGAGEKPGFVDCIASFLSELKKAQADGTQLAAFADRADGVLRDKLSDLSRISTRYAEELSGRLLDADDPLTICAQLVAERGLYRGVHIYLDGYDKFTAQEMAVLAALLHNGCRVTAAFTTPTLFVPESGVFAPAARTAYRVTQCAREAGQAVEPAVRLDKPWRFDHSPGLAHLERELYAYPSTPYPGDPGDVALFHASNPYTEVVALAADINRQVRERGLCYRDVAVIAGDFELYQQLIRTVFPAYGIPVFTDAKTGLLSHPVLMAVMSALDAVTEGYRTQDVLSYLKSGYAGLTPDEADQVETLALACAIEGKDWLEDGRFLVRMQNVLDTYTEEQQEDALRAVEYKNRALAPLIRLKESLAADQTAEGRARAIVAFLEDIGLPALIEAQIQAFRETGDMQLAQQYGYVYNTLMGALDQLVTCLGGDRLGLRRLRTVLESGLRQYEVGTIPPSLDEVFVGDLSRSMVKNVQALYVIGAVDGTFPPRIAEDGLLSDAERAALETAGLELAPTSRARTLDARLEIYTAVTLSGGRLRVSYPAADLDGKGKRPSPLVPRLRALFPALREEDDLLGAPPLMAIGSAASAYNYVLPRLHLPDGDVRTVLETLRERPDYAERLQRAERLRHYKNDVGTLSAARAAGLYGDSLRGSVSRLEKYTACPYSYFLQYGLRAKERKILKLETPDIGWLLHDIVEVFSKQLAADGVSFREVDEQQCAQRIDAIMDAMTSVMFLKKTCPPHRFEALMRRLKKLVLRSVWALCEHVRAGEFEPCAFEFTFGENGDIPPLTIDLPTGETITLTGRIDRIDKYTVGDTAYLKIIDYKSGRKSFSLSDLYNKLSLQLAVYIDAVWENGSGRLGDSVAPAGMFYFRLTDPIASLPGPPGPDELRRLMLEQYKLSGMALRDESVLCAMDRDGTGNIIPVRIKKDGQPYNGAPVATMEQFAKLRDYLRRTVAEIGKEILCGNIALSPYRCGSDTPCGYCAFHPVCAFNDHDNRYRVVRSMKPDEVWEQLDLL